jgi:hypothetical protein
MRKRGFGALLATAVLLGIVIWFVASDSPPRSETSDCTWSESVRAAVAAPLLDWEQGLRDAVLAGSSPDRRDDLSVVLARTETDDTDGTAAMIEYTCVQRQLVTNLASVTFSIFDDDVSVDTYVQLNSIIAVNEGAALTGGVFDSPFEGREEDTDGVEGADLFCAVGRDARCSSYILLRQSMACDLVVIEAQYGSGNDVDLFEARSALLTMSSEVETYLSGRADGAFCRSRDRALPRFLPAGAETLYG